MAAPEEPAPELGASADERPGSRVGPFAIERELGRGGMGVVYLARDERLGRKVAIKALGDARRDDPQFVARIRREARVLAALSHPGIGAIHGLEEHGGQPYLVLEYVAGETLAERIERGPLAVWQALDVTAQIAAALEAAHRRGVVHRDLKPANVKITPEGVVKVLDFGLAKRVLEDDGSAHAPSIEVSEPGVIVGTIAYMSPEQLRGEPVDARSDLWALGCVLYECLCGRRPFVRASAPDTIAAILGREPDWSALPGSVPARVDSLLRRCLSKSPAERPQSAAELAAEIPGSAALRSALAAGATPTPAMVAAAGGEGTLAPRAVAALFALALALLAAASFWARRVFLEGREPPALSPRELAERARSIARGLGHDAPVADQQGLFGHDLDFISACAERGRTRERWGRAEAMYYWHRLSPAPLCPTAQDLSDDLGDVTPFNPPQDRPGMVTLYLDTLGRLLELEALPRPSAGGAADWSAAFAAAGLERGAFEPCAPGWIAPVECDERLAWRGRDPEADELELVVEAGAFGGRVVFFKLLWPWTRPRGAERTPVGQAYAQEDLVHFVLGLAVLAGGAWIARRNVARAVADLRGARRLAGLVFALKMLAWACEAEHVPVLVAEMYMLFAALGTALFDAALLWVAYVALEPGIRRRSPWRIIGWSRLLGARWRDALVGRELLIGTAFGAGVAAFAFASVELAPRLGLEPIPWFIGYQSVLSGNLGSTLAQALWLLSELSSTVVLWFGAFFLALVVLRREWIAVALVMLLIVWTGQEPERWSLVYFPRWLVVTTAAIWIGVALRFGLLATVAGTYVHSLAVATPPLFTGAGWTVKNALLLLAIPVALAVWGAWHAAGLPLGRYRPRAGHAARPVDPWRRSPRLEGSSPARTEDP